MKYQGKALYTSSIRSKIPKAGASPYVRNLKAAALKKIEANINARAEKQ